MARSKDETGNTFLDDIERTHRTGNLVKESRKSN